MTRRRGKNNNDKTFCRLKRKRSFLMHLFFYCAVVFHTMLLFRRVHCTSVLFSDVAVASVATQDGDGRYTTTIRRRDKTATGFFFFYYYNYYSCTYIYYLCILIICLYC